MCVIPLLLVTNVRHRWTQYTNNHSEHVNTITSPEVAVIQTILAGNCTDCDYDYDYELSATEEARRQAGRIFSSIFN